MTPASAINRALSSLKPGDTYTLPDGDILGNIVLPRGLSGSKGKFITIRGGKATRIIATDKSKAAIGGGGIKWLRFADFTTVGGLNGAQASQNGNEYDPAKMIEQVYFVRLTTLNPVDDGIKANGGTEVHVHSCTVIGGKDHGIDFLGIDDGSIRLCDISENPIAITTKGGCRRVAILRNTIHGCRDGLHIGERTSPQWQAPWTSYSAENVDVRGNDISVTGNPVVASQALGINALAVAGANRLTTTKRAKGQMAPVVEVNG